MPEQLPLEAIRVAPERQRKDFGDISSLAASLAKIGLIHPPVVEALPDGTWELIAGERRLRAAQSLGWTSIEVRQKQELSEDERVFIELEENIRRKQLSWQEEVRAIRRYAQIAKAPAEQIAKDLSLPYTSLSSILRVAEEIDKDPKLALASSWTSAYALLRSRDDKLLNSALEGILAGDIPAANGAGDPLEALLGTPPGAPSAAPTGTPTDATPPALGAPGAPESGAPRPGWRGPYGNGPAPTEATQQTAPEPLPEPWTAQKTDFIEWASAYGGRRFNLIHCDFPYGLNMQDANLQNSADRWTAGDEGRYDDSPELFEALSRAFIGKQRNFISDSAHLIFWLSFKHYARTREMLINTGWTVCETPLIFAKTDNAGIAPDVRRWPRRTYEVALFASKGDRKIVKVKAASYCGPTTKEHHLSEKPEAMLAHFLEMVVDEYTEILDPTCGSGNALRVAKKLGAIRGLGLDVLEQHVDYTKKRLKDD